VSFLLSLLSEELLSSACVDRRRASERASGVVCGNSSGELASRRVLGNCKCCGSGRGVVVEEEDRLRRRSFFFRNVEEANAVATSSDGFHESFLQHHY
jgi:hypothetical protein